MDSKVVVALQLVKKPVGVLSLYVDVLFKAIASS